MALRETMRHHVHRAQSFAQYAGNLFTLRSESFAVLQALGVPQAYHLSLSQQGVLVDSFAAALAESKQGGWFAIDTVLAEMRGDRQNLRERYGRMEQLREAHRFYSRRAEKRSTLLPQENKQLLDAALNSAQFTYNIFLRRETNRLASPKRLQAGRRLIREKAGKTIAHLANAA